MPSAVSAEKVGAGATERPWSYGVFQVYGADKRAVAHTGLGYRASSIGVANAALIVAAVNAYHPERDALLVEAVQLLTEASNSVARDFAKEDPEASHKPALRLHNRIAALLTRLRATQAEPSA